MVLGVLHYLQVGKLAQHLCGSQRDTDLVLLPPCAFKELNLYLRLGASALTHLQGQFRVYF